MNNARKWHSGRGRVRIALANFAFVFAGFFAIASPYYTTSGQNIVDRGTRKQVAVLHGVGVGGWLEPEGYMWGSGQYDSPRKIEGAISALIGPAAADSFWLLYHWNFFNEADVKACKGWGMTALRIPLCAGLIQYRDSQPATPPYRYNPEGWRILDSLVVWCDRWQMGIIWDMHCAPGSQNGQNISDVDPAINKATLWSDTATFWPRTRDLWFKIADRYKTHPCVVGYDLLNEPLLSNLGFSGTLLRKLYIELTDTIRTVDTVGIMFLEGQWWARDFTIIEPINWDPHLVITYHEYPPITSCGGMTGSANGNSWDACAGRTKYNIPLWLGETGEQGPPYTVNAQSTDFCNSNNVGWSWWCEKKFNSQNAPWNCPKTSGFNSVLSYWNGGSKPSATDAKNWLFDQARRTALSYCSFDSAMVRSLHPLNPNGVVGVENVPVARSSPGAQIVGKSNAVSIRFETSRHFSVQLVDLQGKVMYRAVGNGIALDIADRMIPNGTYVVRVTSEKSSVCRRVVVSGR